MARVTIRKAKVLGSKAAAVGNLYVTDTEMGVGSARVITQGKVALADIEAAQFVGDTAAKSRAGKVAAFGIFGLAGKTTQDRTTIVLRLRDGSECGYQVVGADAMSLRVQLVGPLRAAGVVVE